MFSAIAVNFQFVLIDFILMMMDFYDKRGVFRREMGIYRGF